MAGMDNLKKSISKKLTLQDYKTVTPQEVKTSSKKKVKLTIYLDEELIKKFNEICSKKLIEKGKPDKSALISKAVELLIEYEKRKINE